MSRQDKQARRPCNNKSKALRKGYAAGNVRMGKRLSVRHTRLRLKNDVCIIPIL